MIRTKTSILAVLLITLTHVIGCTNLQEVQYDIINPSIFPKTKEDAKALVVASALNPFLSDWYGGIYSVASSGIPTITELTTDIGNCQWDAPIWAPLLNFNFNPNSEGATGAYASYINAISSMTMTMARVNAMELDKEYKDWLMAQLHCGRGWLAYLLYDLYGPLQIAPSELLESGEDRILKRSSKDETVSFIKDNLTSAMQYIPERIKASDPQFGTFTKALANTVLMKLAMHEGDWVEAVRIGKELTSDKYGFSLMPHYKDIFTLENENNDEIIWSATCSLTGAKQLWLAHVLPSNYPTHNPSIQKWNGYRVNWSFYNTFEKGDSRLETLVGEYTGTDGKLYNQQNPGTTMAGGAIPVKYGEDPAATGEESQVDYVIYRYADILTLLSEAMVRNSGQVTSEAVGLLNQVRTRANLQPYTVGDFATVDAFLDAVLLERGHELWFENNRRTDLIRHGKYIEYAREYKNASTPGKHMVLMPLPQSIIDEGAGQVIQNPGY